jgi:hypothetical protein
MWGGPDLGLVWVARNYDLSGGQGGGSWWAGVPIVRKVLDVMGGWDPRDPAAIQAGLWGSVGPGYVYGLGTFGPPPAPAPAPGDEFDRFGSGGFNGPGQVPPPGGNAWDPVPNPDDLNSLIAVRS